MAPLLLWLILVLCLAISVTKNLMGVILRIAAPPSASTRKDYSYEPLVSVPMPCFNEGKTVYETIESISKSNYPAEKFEIIAQDDCSVDDSYEWMLKAQRDFTNIRIRVGRIAVNRGKARSLTARCPSAITSPAGPSTAIWIAPLLPTATGRTRRKATRCGPWRSCTSNSWTSSPYMKRASSPFNSSRRRST